MFKSNMTPDAMSGTSTYDVPYDSALRDLQELLQEDVVTLLLDSHSLVKSAILEDIARLCIFFGRQKSNEVLLSYIITYLNDSDWRLRAKFFDVIKTVGAFLGKTELDEYILPLTVQALYDAEDFVIEKVLRSLMALAELGSVQKMRLKELVQVVAPLLCHPNRWIRHGACSRSVENNFQMLRIQFRIYCLSFRLCKSIAFGGCVCTLVPICPTPLDE